MVWHIISPFPVPKLGIQENFQFTVRQWLKMIILLLQRGQNTTQKKQEKAPHLCFFGFALTTCIAMYFVSLREVKTKRILHTRCTYTYLPRAPEILFYDFTYGSEESCLIREAGILRTLDFTTVFSIVKFPDIPLYTAAKTDLVSEALILQSLNSSTHSSSV